MITDIYRESFEQLVRTLPSDYYVGVGNPNSKILIVGREGATEESKEEITERGEVAFADSWLERIENKEPIDFKVPYPVGYNGNPLNGHTWVKYQKLHDLIFERSRKYGKGGKLDFLENIFTTEMNVHRAKRTQGVSTEGMQERKRTFFGEEFIRQFPVVVLACGNYIKNTGVGEEREIDRIFGVEYCPDERVGALPFWVHRNSVGTKLVIHTRQLSGALPKGLLEGIAIVIKDFLHF